MTSTGAHPRSVAVDAVRGLALLGSALGTAVLWLHGRQLGPGYRPLDGGEADRGVDLVLALLVDNRVLGVFALLLGYGAAVHLARGRLDVDPDRPALVLLRRAVLLLGIGAVHAALVLEADVLGTLAVLLVLAVPLVRARTRTHVVVALLVVPALVIHGVADGLGGTAGFPDPPTDYLLSVVDRVGTWLLALVLLPFAQLGLLVAVMMGIRLARAGWLADPAAHRRGLALLGGLGTVGGLLGAWPYARVVAAGQPVDVAVGAVAGAASSITGPAGAVGAVCLTVLVLDGCRTASRRTGLPVVVAGLGVLGRRSLGVYLAHSVVLALVLAPWAGGWGARWGSAGVAGFAVASWLLLLLVAVGAVLATGRGVDAGRGPSAQPTDRQGLVRSSVT